MNTIDQKISDLQVSEVFKQTAAAMGYSTLRDIAAIPPAELISNVYFSFSWFSELITFLEKNGELSLLQPGLENIAG